MTIRIGVIGVGMIGQDHIRRITQVLSGATVTAVADADTDRAREVAAPISGCRVLEAEAVIEDAAVDAILLTSWAESHAAYVLAALGARKPVFCEKPLATTFADCLRIVETEAELGARFVQVGFMRRFDQDFRLLRAAVRSGELGAPLLMHSAHRMGAVPHTHTTAHTVNDAVVHEIDTARWLFDEEIVEALTLTPRHNPNSGLALIDPLIVVLRTESGVLINVEASGNSAYGYDIRGEIVAQNGTCALPDRPAVITRRAGSVSRPVPSGWRERFVNAYDVELQEWVDCLTRGGEPEGPTAWDGLAAAAVTDAIHRALATGAAETVSLPERPALYD